MTILITGAANGLGAALAAHAMARKEKILGIDRHWDTYANFTQTNPIKITADLGDLKGLSVVADHVSAHAPLSSVIFNAAISATGHFEDIPAQAHQKLIDINLAAPMLLTQQLLQNGALGAGSTIVFIASLSVQIGYPGAASYAASKSALANYAASLRKSVKAHKIDVLTVYPGPMQTAQASRHAPKTASAESRMPAEQAALMIWQAIERRQHNFIPGTQNRLFALAGRCAPRLLDKAMRKLIYDKLDRPVY